MYISKLRWIDEKGGWRRQRSTTVAVAVTVAEVDDNESNVSVHFASVRNLWKTTKIEMSLWIWIT